MKYTAAAVIAFSLALSCGGSRESTDVEDQAVQAGPVMEITGEIGVELGDSNFVFGVIEGVDFTSAGDIAVLDSQKKRVSIYSPSGDFLGSFGGSGEGPGELLNPTGIACLPSGGFAVTDPRGREVEIFGDDHVYIETISDFSERAPFVVTGTLNGFAGEQGGFNRDAGTITANLVSWDLSTHETTLLMSTESSFSPEDLAARFMQPQAGITAHGNILFYAPPGTGEYAVYSFNLDTSEEGLLTYPDYSPTGKSQAEIDAEIQAYEDRMQAMASSGRGRMFAGADYDPPRDYYAISSIGIDASGTLWVRRGWESQPVFDLFPAGETVPASTVTVETAEDLSDFTFVITPGGIAAYEEDPEYFPRVLLLQVLQ